jgi:hypothetical protein
MRRTMLRGLLHLAFDAAGGGCCCAGMSLEDSRRRPGRWILLQRKELEHAGGNSSRMRSSLAKGFWFKQLLGGETGGRTLRRGCKRALLGRLHMQKWRRQWPQHEVQWQGVESTLVGTPRAAFYWGPLRIKQGDYPSVWHACENVSIVVVMSATLAQPLSTTP